MIRASATLLTLGLLLVASSVVLADPLDDALAVVAVVGPEGQGNQAAAQAWPTLATASTADLKRLFAALDEANPLAANWLRAAIDAIAERELAAGRPLPAAELEALALDTKRAPRSRRVAYEWLLRIEPAASDRLIPGMLNDPGLEFRRDAVARLIDAATVRLAAGENEAASATFQDALAAARDIDQVNLIAAELDKLGAKVDLVQHFGFVTGWSLLGPFDNTDGVGYAAVYPPEDKIEPAGVYAGKHGEVRWTPHTTDKPLGMVDINGALGKESSVVAYALTEFFADREQDAEIRYGSANANKLWFNGQQVAANEVYHASQEVDQYVARVRLKPGRNVILLKLCQNAMTADWATVWEFQLRVCDPLGAAIHSAKTIAINAPQR